MASSSYSEGLNLGYAKKSKSTTPQPKPKPISYEQATGGDPLTDSEREESRVKRGVAPTKVDDYSDWGVARKAAADEAHAEDRMSVQDKKDQLLIDARDESRYNYEAKPQQQKQQEAKATKNKRQAASNKSKYKASTTNTKFNARSTTGIGFNKSKSGLQTMSSSSKLYSTTTVKDGWTPDQISAFGKLT